MAKASTESIMGKARRFFEKSEKTLEELGKAMGYEEGTARRAAWQFLNKTSDPRLSMLIRFAEAVGIELKNLL